MSPISSPKSDILHGEEPASLILASTPPGDTRAEIAGLMNEKNCTLWSCRGSMKCSYLDSNSTIRLSARIIPIASLYSSWANFSTSRHSQSPHSLSTERHAFTVWANCLSSSSAPDDGPGTLVRIYSTLRARSFRESWKCETRCRSSSFLRTRPSTNDFKISKVWTAISRPSMLVSSTTFLIWSQRWIINGWKVGASKLSGRKGCRFYFAIISWVLNSSDWSSAKNVSNIDAKRSICLRGCGACNDI